MQTLLLPCETFRDLRAISPGQSPSRWQTPSMRSASKWETASPLPNPLRPTCAVGLPSAAMRCGMKGPPGLSNSPRPTCAVGSRPATSRQQFAQCPTVGAGLPLASPFREPRIVGPAGANTKQVCPWQTARHLHPYPAPHEAGDLGADDRQARASTTLWAASPGPSFPRRPAPHNAGAGGEKTSDRTANVGVLAGVSSGAYRRCWRALRQRLRLCSEVR